METFSFIQLVLSFTLVCIWLYIFLNRICNAFEKCSLGKSAALAAILNKVKDDGNITISSTEGSTK